MEYSDILQHLGSVNGIISSITGVVVYYAIKYIDRKFTSYNPTDKYRLQTHGLFTHLDYWIKVGIDNLMIGCPLRKLVFTDLLKIKFKVWKEKLTELAEVRNLDSLNSLELQQLVINSFACAMAEYERQCIDQGIPRNVMDKFNEWHCQRVSSVRTTIENICNSKFLTSPERLACVFDVYYSAFSLTILDAESTLTSLNGHLNNTTYKGVTSPATHN